MSDDPKKQLPAKYVANALKKFQNFSDILVPPALRGSNSLEKVEGARRDFDTGHQLGKTLCEYHKAYKIKIPMFHGKQHQKREPQESVALIKDNRSKLQLVLHRNSLEEYRKGLGLDVLREELIKALLAQVSFDKGVEKLIDYIDKCNLYQTIGNKKADSELGKINYCFPDITDHDIAWLSLADFRKSGLIYANRAPFFYPVTLVDMDLDGLRFAYGLVDESKEHNLKVESAAKLVGLTGVNNQYHLVPFEYRVAQVFKAIVLLSMDDQDLFNNIWSEVGVVPIERGDSMLIESFHEKDSTFRVSDSEVRLRIKDYIQKSIHFLDGPVSSVLDVLKLVGMLEKLPCFMAGKKDFHGYLRMYGTTIEFIDESGGIVESCRVHTHLTYTCSYQFHDQIHDISHRNQVAKRIFDRLKKAVQEELEQTDPRTRLDRLQAEILVSHGVYVPTSVKSRIRKYSGMEMMLCGMIENRVIERTLKFSAREMTMILDLLSRLPKRFASNVAGIRKEVSQYTTLSTLRSGVMESASYCPRTKRITVSIPIETPIMQSRLNCFLDYVMEAKKQKRKTISAALSLDFHEAYFLHAMLHEIGESIWAVLPTYIQEKWTSFSPKTKKGYQRFYLTPYSKTAANEDFAESFAIFMTHGQSFRDLAEKYPVLAEKYGFMQAMWSWDGEFRQFDDESPVSLRSLHGDPNSDMDAMNIEGFIEEQLAQEVWAENCERDFFSEQVLSYEDLAEEVLRDEDSRNPFNKAARRLSRDENQEKLEKMARQVWVRDLVTLKTEQALCQLGLSSIGVNPFFFSWIRFGQKKEAIQYLRKAGAKPKKRIVDTVNRLCRMYYHFEEDLADCSDEKDHEQVERKAALFNAALKWRKEQQE